MNSEVTVIILLLMSTNKLILCDISVFELKKIFFFKQKGFFNSLHLKKSLKMPKTKTSFKLKKIYIHLDYFCIYIDIK